LVYYCKKNEHKKYVQQNKQLRYKQTMEFVYGAAAYDLAPLLSPNTNHYAFENGFVVDVILSCGD